MASPGPPRRPTPSAARRRRRRARVLALKAQGHSNGEIARRVGLSKTWVGKILARARPGGPDHVPEDP